MPCEVVPLRVDFSEMAAIAMKTAKNWALIISCYVLTLFFIHTTSTCIVRSARYLNNIIKDYLKMVNSSVQFTGQLISQKLK
jgi:hypothetical protein